MDIDLKEKDIESAERVDSNSSPRPIRVKFSRWKDKTKIFYKKKSMPSGISVEEDLTDKQIENKFKLDEAAKAAEAGGKRVRWQGKQLFINDVLVDPETL